MKKFILLLVITNLCVGMQLNASILTVSNDPASPGQYTTITAAITAANAGDTLLVSGGASYGDITINKPLTLLGTGYNPNKDFSNSVTQVENVYFTTGASNSSIQGFVFNNNVNSANAGVNNILLRKNVFNSICYVSGNNNWVFAENYFKYSAISIAGNNTIIVNNVFSDIGRGNVSLSNSSSNYNTIFANNTVLLNGTSSVVTLGLNNALITNNIFYTINNVDFNGNYSLGSNNVVSNNVVNKNTFANPFKIGNGNNIGTNNQIGVDPKFSNLVLDANNKPVLYTSNLQLMSSSTVKTGGTDGKEPGIYGGSIVSQNPLRGTPTIPQINSMQVTNLFVAPGGTLKVQLKASAGN